MNIIIKNKKKIFESIRLIMGLVGLFLVVGGFYKSYKYSSFYNEEPSVIIEKSNTSHFRWSSSVRENDDYIKSKFTVLSGNDTIASFTAENNAELTIETNTKKGKAKVLIINEKNDVILFKEFDDNKEIVNLESGEYKIIFVGKYFTGNVILSSNEGSLSK